MVLNKNAHANGPPLDPPNRPPNWPPLDPPNWPPTFHRDSHFLRLPCYFSSKKITMRFCEDIRALSPKVNSASPPRSSFSLFVKKNDGNLQITERRLQIRAGSTPPPPNRPPKWPPNDPPPGPPPLTPNLHRHLQKKADIKQAGSSKNYKNDPPPPWPPNLHRHFEIL